MLLELPKGKYAIIDAEDYERVREHHWYASRVKLKEADYFRVMAFTPLVDGKRECLMLHRFILQAPKGLVVDHINRNPLDCRKANLRICTQQQNTFNRRGAINSASRYKGVYRRGNRWLAAIKHNRKNIHLGYHDTEVQAARAYNEAATAFYGEFALLNPV